MHFSFTSSIHTSTRRICEEENGPEALVRVVQVSGPLMANLRNFAARYRHLDAQQLAFELTGLAKSRGLVDNTLFLVAKVSRIAPVAGASFKTSVHMRSTSPPIGGGILEFFTKPPF